MKKEMKKSGFTLVEIMIVVMIIGLLAAIAIPNFLKARKTTLEKNAINNARQVMSAVDQYAMENAATGAVTVAQYLPYLKGGTNSLIIGKTDPASTAVNSVDPATTTNAREFANLMYPAFVPTD